MNKEDKDRALRLFRALVGVKGKDSDFQRIAKTAATYEEFRIQLVLGGDTLLASGPVAKQWRSHVKRASTAPDTNELMHTLEQLNARQGQIERQLRERDAELLERLRQLDTLTTGLAEIRKESEQLRRLIATYRKAVLHLAETAS